MRENRFPCASHLGILQSVARWARGEEELVQEGMAADFNYAFAWHRPILGIPNLSVAFH